MPSGMINQQVLPATDSRLGFYTPFCEELRSGCQVMMPVCMVATPFLT